MIEGALGAPPDPPGRLGQAAPPHEVLAYLGALTRWRDRAQAALGALDDRVHAAGRATDLQTDVVLALTLWQSVSTRVDAIVAAWDSGRVGDDELRALSSLVWGRLDPNLDAALAVTFVEACRLLDALLERLDERLDADAMGRSGVGDVLVPLRQGLDRCDGLARALGERQDDVAALRRRVDAAVAAGRQGADVRGELAAIAAEEAPLERDLVMADAVQRGITNDLTSFAERLARAQADEGQLRALGVRCAEKIVDPPRLAVPDVDAIGPVPSGGGRTDLRAALDAYGSRLSQLERALAEARSRLSAPLDERAELRGLLDAFQQMAARRGVAEDPSLADHYRQARQVLWQAPCDLVAGRRLVEAYRAAVHRPASTEQR